MWPFKQSTGFLGVDIGSHGVKLVELRKKGKRAHLFTYAFTDKELPQNQEGKFLEAGAVADLLKKMIKAARAVSRSAAATLPASAVFSSLVSLPKNAAKEEKNEFVKREAEKLSPWPLAEVVLDWKTVNLKGPNGEKNEKALITAAPKKLIASYSEIFKMAGLSLLSLETEALALVYSLIGKDDSPAILVDIGATQTDIFAVEMGIPLSFQSLSLGGKNFTEALEKKLSISFEEAERFKRDLPLSGVNQNVREGFPAVFEPVVKPLLDNLRYTLDVYRRQKGGGDAKVEKIILTGGASLIPFLETKISQELGIKTYLGDPWARVIYDEALKPSLDAIGPRFSAALGLVLKRVEG